MNTSPLALIAAALLTLNLNAPNRLPAEKERDVYNKPADLYAFWGIKEGDTVVDFDPGEGYNTYLLSQLVGPKGRVIALGSYGFDKLEARLKADPLPNVQHVKSEALATLPEGSVDVIVTIRNYHDLKPDQAPRTLADMMKALKPGGVLGVVDSRASQGRDVPNHRIADDVIRAEITAAGYKLAGTSEMLANKDDDHTKPNWEKRYTLDQSCFKFVK